MFNFENVQVKFHNDHVSLFFLFYNSNVLTCGIFGYAREFGRTFVVQCKKFCNSPRKIPIPIIVPLKISFTALKIEIGGLERKTRYGLY